MVPAAVEPAEYVGDTKTCTKCGSAAHSVFKFLNNKKRDQPRYRCMACNTYYTHHPPGKARTRPQGKKYDKHTLCNPPSHAATFDLRCPNSLCRDRGLTIPRFMYSNNKNPLQPRYKYLACEVMWQPQQWNLSSGLDEVAPTPEYVNASGDDGIEGAAPTDDMHAVQPHQQWSYNSMQGLERFLEPNSMDSSDHHRTMSPGSSPEKMNANHPRLQAAPQRQVSSPETSFSTSSYGSRSSASEFHSSAIFEPEQPHGRPQATARCSQQPSNVLGCPAENCHSLPELACGWEQDHARRGSQMQLLDHVAAIANLEDLDCFENLDCFESGMLPLES